MPIILTRIAVINSSRDSIKRESNTVEPYGMNRREDIERLHLDIFFHLRHFHPLYYFSREYAWAGKSNYCTLKKNKYTLINQTCIPPLLVYISE